jgi:hypothetical protein
MMGKNLDFQFPQVSRVLATTVVIPNAMNLPFFSSCGGHVFEHVPVDYHHYPTFARCIQLNGK